MPFHIGFTAPPTRTPAVSQQTTAPIIPAICSTDSVHLTRLVRRPPPERTTPSRNSPPLLFPPRQEIALPDSIWTWTIRATTSPLRPTVSRQPASRATHHRHRRRKAAQLFPTTRIPAIHLSDGALSPSSSPQNQDANANRFTADSEQREHARCVLAAFPSLTPQPSLLYYFSRVGASRGTEDVEIASAANCLLIQRCRDRHATPARYDRLLLYADSTVDADGC